MKTHWIDDVVAGAAATMVAIAWGAAIVAAGFYVFVPLVMKFLTWVQS